MEALNRLPGVLHTLEEMRQTHSLEHVFINYKNNVRLFVEEVKKQVSDLINKYEETIYKLRLEIKHLKNQKPTSQFIRTARTQGPISNFNSPSKGDTLDEVQITNSIFTPSKPLKIDDFHISAILKKKKSFEQFHHFPELMSPQQSMWEHNQSKFQAASRKRKQRDGELRIFLESGNKNMNLTTSKFLQVVGKAKSVVKEEKKHQNNDQNQNQEEKFEIKKEESLNKSLGHICESLDTSFVAKKARSQKKKNELKILEEKKRKERVQQETARMLKDRGIKNLLQKLRENVQASPKRPPEFIASSKLLSCGQKCSPVEKLSPGKSRSKVMINPVPIDICRRSQATSRSRSNSPSTDHKPQSILKQNSTILSKSISAFTTYDRTI